LDLRKNVSAASESLARVRRARAPAGASWARRPLAALGCRGARVAARHGMSTEDGRSYGRRKSELDVGGVNADVDCELRLDESDDASRNESLWCCEPGADSRAARARAGAAVVALFRGRMVMRPMRHRRGSIVHWTGVQRRWVRGENREPATEQQRGCALNPGRGAHC